MTDGFVGAWLVTEYVFGEAGTFIGKIRQQRRLEQLDNARVRVTQICDPDPDLAGHAMAAFEGEWVFELSVAGADRLYLGPDVIGRGTEWAEGVMTGRGLWPRFGHTFRSFSVMVEPGRQLTGGTFSSGSALDASIAGVAVPDDGSRTFPELPSLTADFALVDAPWVSRSYGPVQESEVWLGPDDHRVRLVIHDAITATSTAIEIRNGTEGTVTVTG